MFLKLPEQCLSKRAVGTTGITSPMFIQVAHQEDSHMIWTQTCWCCVEDFDVFSVGNRCLNRMFKKAMESKQWLFLVPLIGGTCRWYIFTQLAIYTTYIPLIYVPGSGSPPHPPCHGHGHNPSTPLRLWNGWALGRGGRHPTSNQQQCNW